MGALTKTVTRVLGRGEPLPVLLEIQSDLFEDVKRAMPQFGLRTIWDISIDAHRFVSLEAVPPDLVQRLADIPGVNVVHYDAPIRFYGPFGFLQGLKEGLRPRDFLMGKGISPVQILSGKAKGRTEGFFGTEEVWTLTGGEQAKSDGYDGSGTKVCVIDTGVWNMHQAFNRKVKTISVSRYLADKFFDSSGHGSWCAAMVAGESVTSPQGYGCRGMSKAQLISVKALRSPVGISRTSDILKAIEMAMVLDPKIFSMSLGGEASESAAVDPLCKVIATLTAKGKVFVVAVGNSGPGAGTIDSPGHSPDAITVGAVSITDGGKVSYFSSRGPSIDNLTKPDVVFYGGGRVNKEDAPAEKLVGPTGYLSTSDAADRIVGLRPRQAYAALMGSSMATPGVAGRIAIWNDMFKDLLGREVTLEDLKEIFQAAGHAKSNEDGHGLLVHEWVYKKIGQPAPPPEETPEEGPTEEEPSKDLPEMAEREEDVPPPPPEPGTEVPEEGEGELPYPTAPPITLPAPVPSRITLNGDSRKKRRVILG